MGPVADPCTAPAIEVPAHQPLALRGWALDTGRKTAASAIDFVLNGVAYRTELRVPRGDVAQAFGLRTYLRSGFNTELPKVSITPGRHDLEVRVLVAGTREYVSVARTRFEAS